MAPAAVELASFLIFDAPRLDVPRDEVVADFLDLYGDRFDDTALQLALIGGMVQLGPNPVLDLVLGGGDEARASAVSQLGIRCSPTRWWPSRFWTGWSTAPTTCTCPGAASGPTAGPAPERIHEHEVVFESRENHNDAKDRQTIIQAKKAKHAAESLIYRFERPDAEPLLWLPDAVAGAVSAAEAQERRYLDLLRERITTTRIAP